MGIFRRATVSETFYFPAHPDVSLKLMSRFVIRYALEPALVVARALLIVLLLAAGCYTKIFASVHKGQRRVLMVCLEWVSRLKTKYLTVHKNSMPRDAVDHWTGALGVISRYGWAPSCLPLPLIQLLVVVRINDGHLAFRKRDFTVQWGWGHGRSSRTIRLVRCLQHLTPLLYLFLFVSTISAQAPIGVCLSNVAQTISNGVIAPIPYASVALCSSGSTAANCVANKVSIYTSAALSTATPTNPFTSDAGGNYFFCAAAGDYALLINSSYGQYFVPDIELVDDWSKGGTMTGALTDAAGFIGPLTGNASTASALAATPSACNPSSYFAYGIAANGNALCNALPAGETLYYQTVQTAGSALTQQPALNFDGTVVATNGTGKTNVGLPSVGTAGTYANPSSITTDAQGRVTSINNGTMTQADVTGIRAFGTSYTAGATPLTVLASGSFTSGNGDSRISATVNGVAIPGNVTASTIPGYGPSITFNVPAGGTYSVTYSVISGSHTYTLGKWIEWTW